MQFGVIDLALVGLDRTIELADGCGLGVELLLGDDAFLEKQFVTLQVHFGVVALGLILGELTLGLFELNLKGARIDFREQIALFHILPFFESDIDELAVDPAAHGDRVERSDRSKSVQIDGKIAFGGGRDNDRNAENACAAATSASFA